MDDPLNPILPKPALHQQQKQQQRRQQQKIIGEVEHLYEQTGG